MQSKTKKTSETGSARDSTGKAPLYSTVLALGSFVVASATAAGVAWGLDAEAASRGRARVHEVRGAVTMLAHAVQREVDAGQVEALPRLLTDVATTYDLSTCRVRVPNAATIAEAGMGAGALGTIPDQLPTGARRTEEIGKTLASFAVPVRAGSSGELLLEVSASVAAPWNMALARLGVPIVLGVGVVALLLAQRLVASRLRALGAIGRALDASLQERDGGALMVSEATGSYAKPWNAIVGEREALRRFAAFKEATEPGRAGGVSSELAAACDVLTQGILILDERLRVKYANGAAATLLAGKRDGMVNTDLRSLVADSEVIGALEGMAKGKVRQRVSVESSRVGPQGKAAEVSGERAGSVLRFSARPVRREEHGVVMVVVEDVTQQKVADEARNGFVAQATHELRTPLTNIRLYTEAMIEDSDNAEMRAKSLNVISSESRRLERIVADMLSVSEIEAGTLKIVRGDVRLDQLFDELKEDYRAMAEDKEINLVFELPPKLPVVSGDRDKLALAWHNLIANAIKYTPAGGQVTIRAEDTPGRFLMHVIDNGIGIRSEEQELVFDRFYRAKDNRVANLTGTGLGLTLARDIARLHGGDIVLRSEIDKGSTFTFELPTVAEGAMARAA